jgi:CRP-like cAMP-binding protein
MRVALEIGAVKAEATRNPPLAMELSRAVAGQWRMAVRHILDLRCRSVPQRLAKFLLRLVEESPHPDEAELPFSKGALAARIGTTPETLSRAIQSIATIGLLLRGRKIILRERSLVTWFCEPSLYPGEDERRLKVHAY